MTPEQRESFDTNGYVMIENAIEGEDLERVQKVFLEGQAETRAKWEADGCPRGFFDIPNILERDDIFLDLMHYQSTFPVMEEVIGPDIQLMGIQARTYPPNPTSYTNWHKDCPPWSHPQYALKSKLSTICLTWSRMAAARHSYRANINRSRIFQNTRRRKRCLDTSR